MKQAALLVTLILALAAAASARPPEGGPPRGGDRLEQLIERLDLPPEVLSEVDEVIDTSRDRQRDLRRELRSAHEAMRGLLEAELPDEGAVLAQAEEVGRLRTELDKDRLRTLLRVQALLPADARDRLVEQMKRRGRGHRDRIPPRGDAATGRTNGPDQGGGEDF